MKPASKNNLSLRLKKHFCKVALEASEKAGKNSLKYFQSKVKVIKKEDLSPVTRADREAEEIIRKELRQAFPEHLITGEEYGTDGPENSEFQWWIDPIDGTMQFIRGIPFWGSVVGLEYQNEVIAGVIHHPAIGLSIWASQANGCYANNKKTQVSKTLALKEATICFGGIKALSAQKRNKLMKLIDASFDHRGFGDCYAHSLVIMGHADLMAEFRVNPYDISAIKICVEEAGGKFTDLKGIPSIHAGSALSSNLQLHSKALSFF